MSIQSCYQTYSLTEVLIFVRNNKWGQHTCKSNSEVEGNYKVLLDFLRLFSLFFTNKLYVLCILSKLRCPLRKLQRALLLSISAQSSLCAYGNCMLILNVHAKRCLLARSVNVYAEVSIKTSCLMTLKFLFNKMWFYHCQVTLLSLCVRKLNYIHERSCKFTSTVRNLV